MATGPPTSWYEVITRKITCTQSTQSTQGHRQSSWLHLREHSGEEFECSVCHSMNRGRGRYHLNYAEPKIILNLCTQGNCGYIPYLLPLPLRLVKVYVTGQSCAGLCTRSHTVSSLAPLLGGSPRLEKGTSLLPPFGLGSCSSLLLPPFSRPLRMPSQSLPKKGLEVEQNILRVIIEIKDWSG